MEPTPKQISYLATLTGLSREWELDQYVGRIVGKPRNKVSKKPLTKADYSRAIDHAQGR